MIVTIFNLKGQLVGNFSKSDLTLTKSDLICPSAHESSSETLRENLKILSIHHPKFKKPSSDKDFGYYLAGFIEAGEHCYFNNDELIIIFHEKNISLAYFFKSYIKFGHIKKINNCRPAHTAIIYVISHKIGIIKILNLINGKIRTHLK
jgi:hypothetical protein